MKLDLNKLVAQGKVISPLKCTISMDAIAESKVENLSDHLYNYKGRMWMVDDQICVSHCGLDSALATTPQHLDKPQEERLQFGAQKCLKLHVGIKCRICPELSIDTWKLEKPSED